MPDNQRNNAANAYAEIGHYFRGVRTSYEPRKEISRRRVCVRLHPIHTMHYPPVGQCPLRRVCLPIYRESDIILPSLFGFYDCVNDFTCLLLLSPSPCFHTRITRFLEIIHRRFLDMIDDNSLKTIDIPAKSLSFNSIRLTLQVDHKNMYHSFNNNLLSSKKHRFSYHSPAIFWLRSMMTL